jgi:hypothetical protein
VEFKTLEAQALQLSSEGHAKLAERFVLSLDSLSDIEMEGRSPAIPADGRRMR